jgi:hypothetical protein
LVVTLTVGAGTASAAAQTPQSEPEQTPAPAAEAEEEDRSFTERMRGVQERMRDRGLTVDIGTIVAGSGAAAGAEFIIPRVGELPIGADVEGRVSVAGYWEAALRVGLLKNRHHTSEMRPADRDVTSLFRDTRENVPGLSLYLEHAYRRLPGLSLYGTDVRGNLTRADYGRSGSTTDAVLQWQRSRSFGLTARAGLLDLRLFSGMADDRENTATAFGYIMRESERVRYAVVAAGLSVDRRDSPHLATKGFRVDALVRRFESQAAGHPSFTRLSFDVRGYRALSARHVLAARVLGSASVGAGPSGVPFYLMESLGGSRALRSFDSYRLRGERLLAVSVESRWRVSRRIEVTPFLDAGTIARPPLPGTPGGLLWSPGVGVRARTSDRVFIRADFAYGREGGQVVVGVDAPF